MSRVQQAIEVGVPVHAAYQQLTHFENYPLFMSGVTQVDHPSATEATWVLQLDGQTRCDMQLTECLPDHRVMWQSTDEPLLTEAITLKSVSPGRTQIIAELDADARALMPGDAQAQDTLSRRLKADLGRFKEYVESHLPAADAAQARPDLVQPAPNQPALSQPALSQPALSQPALSQPDRGQAPVAEPARRAARGPNAGPASARQAKRSADAGKATPATVASAKTANARTESTRAESTRAESTKATSTRATGAKAANAGRTNPGARAAGQRGGDRSGQTGQQ